jgi:hypothetical protein
MAGRRWRQILPHGDLGLDVTHWICEQRAPVRRAEQAYLAPRCRRFGGVAERSMAADCKSADFASTKVRILPPPPTECCVG